MKPRRKQSAALSGVAPTQSGGPASPPTREVARQSDRKKPTERRASRVLRRGSIIVAKPNSVDSGSTDRLMDTSRLIQSARSGDQIGRARLADAARGGLKDLWLSYLSLPTGIAPVNISDSLLDQLIAFYPVAMRARLGEALREVERLAAQEVLSDEGLRLLRLYRSTGDLVEAKTLPVSLQLWVVLAVVA